MFLPTSAQGNTMYAEHQQVFPGRGDGESKPFIERRINAGDRRSGGGRRCHRERRSDRRVPGQGGRKTLWTWLRSLFRPRLGVDRRKNIDRRSNVDRRKQGVSVRLTAEELRDLLSD